MHRSPLVIVAAGACVLALVGCSSDAKTEVDASAATSPSTSASASPPVSLDGTVTDTGTKDASGDGDTPVIELAVADNSFGPTFTKVAPGAVVTLKLKNEGTRDHTFTLADGAVDQALDPGQSAEVTVTVPATGSASFYCSIHQSSGMQGAFFTSASGSGSSGSSSTTSTSATSSSTTVPVYGGY
jgi:plastocyanin